MRVMGRGVLALVLVTASMLALEAQRQLDPSVRESWTVRGVERTALVAGPAAPAPHPGSPLVLVFHGHGGTSAHSARTFAMHTHWPEAVVLYPQGLPTPGRVTDPEGRRSGWQHAPGEQRDRDLEFVDVMLAWARARFTIDPARIYAAGHSNGGTMTYVLWAARGDVFAALAPSASVFRRDLQSVAKPKPALIIAGQRDELVPLALQRRGLDAALRLNRATSTGVPWGDGRAMLHTSAIGAHVVAWVHPGGHAMPDDAGAVMTTFFKEHARRPR